MKLNFHNSVLKLPTSKPTYNSKLPKAELLIKLTPVLSILLTALVFKSWPILFALLYLPVQYVISGLKFCFDLSNLEIDYTDIIDDLDGMH